LQHWTSEEALRLVGREPVGAIVATPGFNDVNRRSIENWLPRPGEDRMLAATMRDIGRLVSGVWAIYLAASPGGLTLSRLSKQMEGTLLSSPGRARALLIYMRFLGYIEPLDEPETDGRERRFGPTDRLRDAFRERYRRDLEIFRPFGQVFCTLAERLDEPAVFDAFAWAHGDFLSALYKVYAPDEPSLDLFSNRYSGMVLLARLLLAGGKEDCFPPAQAVSFTVAGLARDAGISRAQVRRLLRDSEKVGFIEMVGEGRLRLTPWLAHNVRYLTGSSIIILGASAQAALDYLGAVERNVA
jgi:hypothetical protein